MKDWKVVVTANNESGKFANGAKSWVPKHFKTKREAQAFAEKVNAIEGMGIATVERSN